MAKVTNQYKRVPLDQIVVNADQRQRSRSELKVETLLTSIKKYGVLKPILVDDSNGTLVLIAGERRLTASKELGLPDIPVRFLRDLNESDLQRIELEENLKRSQLIWQDEAKAINILHNIYLADAAERGEEWTALKSSQELGIEYNKLLRTIRVAGELGNKQIAAMESLNAAYNFLSRKDERKVADAMSLILDTTEELFTGILAKSGQEEVPFDAVSIGDTTEPHANPVALAEQTFAAQPISPKAPQNKTFAEAVAQLPPQKSKVALEAEAAILNQSFLDWAPNYNGRKFNFLHCDFPYGIDFNAGEMGGKGRQPSYNDNPNVYWELIQTLCNNLDKLISHSSHILFWFSMEHYSATLEAFAKHPQGRFIEWNLHPMYWMKSDNVGIMPDPKRGPRRVVETCLMGATGDRLVVKPVANGYHAPTDKSIHISCKPVPVLRHFFHMIVDENTHMLDPTCGSGSSLRAAETLKAGSVLGLEIDEQYCTDARRALRDARLKALAAEVVK